MKSLYLLVNCFTILIPFIFSFHPRIRFYKVWKYYFPAMLLVALIFISWDAIFTNAGIWHFNEKYITGFTILNLPIEEILFFICIPYACVFTWYCLQNFYDFSWNRKAENIFAISLASVLLIIGLIFYDRLYTSVTFISTAFTIIAIKYILKIQWFGKFVTVYVILLIPFFIVNGVLTGFGLAEPVVIYNNAANLGIRIFTIPIEDIFYGFEMILLNVYLFYAFQKIYFHKPVRMA